MKNNKLLRSTIILLIGGLIVKVLSMVIRIILTRNVGSTGIGLYMLILPTFNLFITLCLLGLPVAIAKLVSENKKSNRRLILSITPVILIFDLILMLLLFLITPIISKYLLKNSLTYYPILAVGLTLPFISISGIIKGYFFGKEKMFPQSLANVIEQIIRLGCVIYIIPNIMKYGLSVVISGVVLINVLSELGSIIVNLLFLPRNIKINISDINYSREDVKDILNIGLPTTGSRLVGSLGYFLEPIILSLILTKVGYSTDYITTEYGIINGYVFSLLLIPSFFTVAISNSLLPIISNAYSHKRYNYATKKIKQACFYSLLIGIPVTILIILFPNFFLKLIYNTTSGTKYLLASAPIFILYYIQGVLTSSMQAMNLAKEAMQGTLYGTFIRATSLILFSIFKIGMWGLIISNCLNIIYVTIHHFYYVKKYLKS